MYKTLELFLREILPEVQLKPGPLDNNLHDDHIHPLVKSFIDGAADCFDNSRDAKRVSSAILLLVNCNLCSNKLSVSLPLGI